MWRKNWLNCKLSSKKEEKRKELCFFGKKVDAKEFSFWAERTKTNERHLWNIKTTTTIYFYQFYNFFIFLQNISRKPKTLKHWNDEHEAREWDRVHRCCCRGQPSWKDGDHSKICKQNFSTGKTSFLSLIYRFVKDST